MRIEDIITEAEYARLTGRDGLEYFVWRNPSQRELVNQIAKAPHGREGMRAMLTEHDLYFWQSANVLHGDFSRQTGIDGVRVTLHQDGIVQANEETVGVPEEFPWIFTDGDAMDIADRRLLVETWLRSNRRLAVIYPGGFRVSWYM